MEEQLLPEEVRTCILTDPAFIFMLEKCLEEPEFISGFSRLYGVELTRNPRNALEAMVDQATNYRKDSFDKFFTAFIPFVHRVVYLPLKSQFEAGQVKGEF